MVRALEEKCVQQQRSLKNDAKKFYAEMGVSLELKYPDQEVYNEAEEKIKVEAVGKEWLKKEQTKREQVKQEKHWFFKERWADEDLVNCLSWLRKWRLPPSHSVAGISKLHNQLLPTKLYHQNKIGTLTT